MIFTKESKFVEVLKKINSKSITKNTSSDFNSLDFCSNGCRINLENNSGIIGVKIPNCDVDCRITNNLFTTIFLAEISKGDVEVKNDERFIYINNIKFPIENRLEDTILFKIDTPDISFSSEQFLKLEEDFKNTISNCYVSLKAADVIGFYLHDGSIKEVVPSVDIYKFAKLDAVVDTASLEHKFGHSTFIKLVPRKIYDFLKNDGTVKVIIENSKIIFASENILIEYVNCEFGTSKAEKYDSFNLNTEETINSSIFGNFKELSKLIELNSSEEKEDYVINVKATDTEISYIIDDVEIFREENKAEKSFNISCIIQVFNKMLEKDYEIDFIYNGEYSHFILFGDENEKYIILNYC